MKDVYTFRDLAAWEESGSAIRLGVLGDPVAHSLSPRMQNAALTGVTYARFQIAPNELATAIQLLRELDFIGLNLTAPHKVAALALVHEADAFAQQVGAINTIRFAEGKSFGANTDGLGFERGVRESFEVELRTLRVLVLGAGGGAGQAVAAQSALAGCPSVALANRNFLKAQNLAHRLERPGVFAVRWSDDSLGKALAGCDLVVNATPLGWQPNDPSPLPAHLLRSNHLVYDLNYRPTALVATARDAGARAAGGLTMLLHQGALAFEFWFDQPAPLAAMRAALAL